MDPAIAAKQRVKYHFGIMHHWPQPFYQPHTLSPLAFTLLPARTTIFPCFEETYDKIIGPKVSYKGWLRNGLDHITILVEANSSQEKLNGLEL